jgi:hypothetical protein
MLTRVNSLSVVCIVSLLVCLVAISRESTALAQSSAGEFQKILSEKAAFESADFAALQQGETIVKVTPITHKREIAVSGVVALRTNAEQFLRLYLDGMTRTNNTTVLEGGRFGNAPAVVDLQQLTIEPGDVDDLKQCVAGDCQIKLSAKMIERLRREVDWQAADYQARATQLLKTMLVDYVRDYLARGPAALIEYNDKRDGVRLADEQQALASASGYLNDLVRNATPGMRVVEDAIIWSKIKFGLKPVLVINHVRAYMDERNNGPQVLVASNQIYANHYFTGSLALTGFVNVTGAAPYLVYENRSRTDGLTGPFGKIKRGVIESKSLEGLRSILEHSKLRLEGSAVSAEATAVTVEPGSWRQRLFGGIRPLLWLLVLSALAALLLLRRFENIRVPIKQTRIDTRGKL